MGNLLNLLYRDDSCCAIPKHDLFVDFENAAPSPDEAELYQEAEDILQESREILEKIKNYKGASEEIRVAIKEATPENELAAWQAMVPLVFKVKDFYEFSLKLDAIIPKLLKELCSGKDPNSKKAVSVTEQLDAHQALVKQFAKILEFVFEFDEWKLKTSDLQNDFSYFKRVTQRMRSTALELGSSRCEQSEANGVQSTLIRSCRDMETIITSRSAGTLSLFLANSNPMLHSVSVTTTSFLEALKDTCLVRKSNEVLSVMAKVCQTMLATPDLKERIQNEETELFILRVMVAIIILYDHVNPTGAFAKGSSVDVKGCVKVLKDHPRTSLGLINALMFTTRHMNDESTPKSTRALILEVEQKLVNESKGKQQQCRTTVEKNVNVVGAEHCQHVQPRLQSS